MNEDYFTEQLAEFSKLIAELFDQKEQIAKIADILTQCIAKNNKIYIAGNGGSAADAQHFAAELVGRFQKNRKGLPCIAINTDTSALTAIGNDFGFDQIFARQIESLAQHGDIFIGISTSGNSENILKAIDECKKLGVKTVGLLGRNGGEIRKVADFAVIAPHEVTARIQEAHIIILHYWADRIERSVL